MKKWTHKKDKGEFMKRKDKSYRYSRLFKQEVLDEIRKENLTVQQASRYYLIPFQTIYRWLKKEGIPSPQREVFYVSLSKKNEIIKENEKLKSRIAELEKLVSDLSLDKACHEALFKNVEKEYKINLKKNFGTKA